MDIALVYIRYSKAAGGRIDISHLPVARFAASGAPQVVSPGTNDLMNYRSKVVVDDAPPVDVPVYGFAVQGTVFYIVNGNEQMAAPELGRWITQNY